MVLETKPHQNRNSVRPVSADTKHFRHHRNPLRTVAAFRQLLTRDYASLDNQNFVGCA